MARGSNPFQIADASKRKLTQSTAKRLKRLYKEVSDDLLLKYNRTIGDESVSGQLRKTYYSEFRSELDKSIANLTSAIEGEITWASYTSAQLPVEASKFVVGKAGLNLAGAYAYVPEQVVGNLLSGSLYKGDWTLSQALWKAGNKTKTDVQRIIAKGLAENLSTKEISHSLEQYLVPGARKPWDWNKVYPGTAAKVDYNAQRLARTMIQHSYEQALIESTQNNPWVNGIVWHSAHSSRVCEICAERDGQIFPVKDLPLDHPNGMCFFEPAIDDMSKIGEDLAAWVNGEPNKGIDKYIATAYGYKPSSKLGRASIKAARNSASAQIVTPKTLENLEKHIEDIFNRNTRGVQSIQKDILEFAEENGLPEDFIEQSLKKVIDNNDYCMRMDIDLFDTIIKDGRLKNQFETGSSGGALSSSIRERATKNLFGADISKLSAKDYEKYGYLGSKNRLRDFESSGAGQYGNAIFVFNKDRLKNRATFTIDDSLSNVISRDVVGSLCDKPHWMSIPTYYIDDVQARIGYKNLYLSEHADIYDLNGLGVDIGRYFELQYHGDVTMDDVSEVVVRTKRHYDLLSKDFIDYCNKHNIRITIAEE